MAQPQHGRPALNIAMETDPAAVLCMQSANGLSDCLGEREKRRITKNCKNHPMV